MRLKDHPFPVATHLRRSTWAPAMSSAPTHGWSATWLSTDPKYPADQLDILLFCWWGQSTDRHDLSDNILTVTAELFGTGLYSCLTHRPVHTAHTLTDSSHTLNHWDTHRASVYLMSNLNWSCYSCPMGRPPPLCLPPARSSEHFRLIFCPLPASSVFLFWPSWAELSLSVYRLGSQSSHQTWPHRIASLCSLLLSSHFLFPPTLLCLSFSSSPLFSSTSSEEDRGLGPAAVSGAAYGLWSDRKPRKVTDRLLELILCSHKTSTVAQSNKYTRWRVHIGKKTGWLCS